MSRYHDYDRYLSEAEYKEIQNAVQKAKRKAAEEIKAEQAKIVVKVGLLTSSLSLIVNKRHLKDFIFLVDFIVKNNFRMR